MAKKIFLTDIDLALNQLLQAKLENLAADPTNSESRIYYNTVIKKVKYYNGTAWLTVIDDLDARLTNSRTPTSHVIATNTALGPEHTISGAAVGWVLRASGANTANFQQLAHSDLSGAGTNTHAQIDTHLADATKHRIINDAGTSNTELFSAARILQLVADVNTSIAGSLIYKGGYDAATNSPLLDATPMAVTQGWTYVVTVAGVFFTEAVQVGDMLIAKQTNPTTLAHWTVVNKNIPDIVAATTAMAGIVQLATNAETIAGTDATKAVTPASLQAKVATETEIGLIEIATQAEVTTGTDDSKALTPLKLKTHLANTVGGYSATFGDGALTSFTITHSLNTNDVIVEIIEVSTGETVEMQVRRPTANAVNLQCNLAPTLNQYKVIIKK